MTATQATTQFNFNGCDVRVIVQDGDPWFVASDVCSALDYKNTSDALATHLDDDEKMTIANGESHSGKRGGSRLMTIINESGLYALVLRSRKPESRKFAKWVTSEVLPSIRKTGRYEAPAAQQQPTMRARRWLIATDAHGAETVQPIGQDDFITTWPRLVKDVASGECMCSSAELLEMAVACMQRLKHRVPARQALPA